MKKERIKILQKVANGELTLEQADEQLLCLSIDRGSFSKHQLQSLLDIISNELIDVRERFVDRCNKSNLLGDYQKGQAFGIGWASECVRDSKLIKNDR